jgi:hypothetical protein
MSNTAYLTTFWESQQESTLWREAGFPTVPSLNTMETNFRLLETCGPGIEAAAYKLMRWAEQCDRGSTRTGTLTAPRTTRPRSLLLPGP